MAKTIAACVLCLLAGAGVMYGGVRYVLSDKIVLNQEEARQVARYFFGAGVQAAAQSCSRTES